MLTQRFISILAVIAFAMISSLGVPNYVQAQEQTPIVENIKPLDKEAQKAAQKAAEAARESAEKRIEAQMIEMSDVTEALIKNLGQLHYLRALCFGEQDQYWRDFAGRMLQLEAGNDDPRRETLTRAFNAGYFLEEQRFKTCSAGVAIDAAALAENGRRLASMLGDPYRDF